MKNLFELCKPRESVFDETKRDDVLNLSNLIEGNINPKDFFAENYLTNGMKALFDAAFKRFIKAGATGVVKLTQAMGGGKTHNMLALGLIASNPEYRDNFLPESHKYKDLGKVKVVAFTGRESDAPLGIWGAIAEQLGKKDMFNQYYSPLSAPGETAWIKLLEGEPLLILLDELPPYLENAKAKMIGNSDLCQVTSIALSNLFSAIGKGQLSNVCLVISDLKATYESGSELIRSSFKNLENEVNRSSLNIEPVGSTSDEVYYILRKRLFENMPDSNEINQVALGYQEAVSNAKKMGFTTTTPESVYTGIKDSYPFHPSIRDLYARFKENQGFQQTRGLIRLMRQIVTGLYSDSGKQAKEKYLINVFDFNLNDSNMLTTVSNIKPELSNAIAHDIASNGKAVAEEIDARLQGDLVSDVSKLILVASLANVPNALLGLSLSEVIANLCEPKRDIAGLKKALDEFQMKAWYLEHDKDGRLFFKNTKNMIAELHSLVESYDNDGVKSTTLKKFLEEKFKPTREDCYQELMVFPAVDEINLMQDKVTLVLFEPYTGQGLHPELNKFYENEPYKNRVMFLSGSRDTMNRLYSAAKELKAIEKIIKNMEDEKVPEENQQFQLAQDTKIKKIKAVLSAAQQTFGELYYPNRKGINTAEFSMQFKDCKYDGEDQIRKLLIEKRKLTDETVSENMRIKCEQRLFTRKEMRYSEIKERAASDISWPWHHPKALDSLLDNCLDKDLWRMQGDYIEKGPFEKDPTSVTVTAKSDNEETGKVTLRLMPKFGDTIYYEIGADATETSALVEDPNNFETPELKLSFLCVDSSGEHPTGDPVSYQREIKVKHKIIDTPNGQSLKLQSQPGVKIKYTTDGSDPKENGGVYEGDVIIPSNAKYVQVVAEYEDSFYDSRSIPIDSSKKKELEIDKERPMLLRHFFTAKDSKESYANLETFKKYAESLSDVRIVLFKLDDNGSDSGYIELNIDTKIPTTAESIEITIDNLKDSFVNSGRANIEFECGSILFKSGQAFYDFVNERGLSLSQFKQEEITRK